MRWLHHLNNRLARIEKGILTIGLLAMVFLSFLQVILRNIFSTGLLWSDALVRHLVLWVGFMGASLATKDRNHIKVDLLSRAIPARFERTVQILLDLFACIVSFILFVAAWDFLLQEKMSGDRLFLNIPSWVVQSIIPITFFMIGFRFLINILVDLFSKKPPHAESVPPITLHP